MSHYTDTGPSCRGATPYIINVERHYRGITTDSPPKSGRFDHCAAEVVVYCLKTDLETGFNASTL